MTIWLAGVGRWWQLMEFCLGRPAVLPAWCGVGGGGERKRAQRELVQLLRLLASSFCCSLTKRSEDAGVGIVQEPRQCGYETVGPHRYRFWCNGAHLPPCSEDVC